MKSKKNKKKLSKMIKKIFDIALSQVTEMGGSMLFLSIMLLVLVLQQVMLFTQLFVSIVLIFSVVIFFKGIFYTPRPLKKKHTNFIEKIDASSFPSAHTMRAVSLAIIFSAYFNDILTTIFFSIFAALVAFSRLYLKKHYLRDILGGAVMSALMTTLVIQLI